MIIYKYTFEDGAELKLLERGFTCEETQALETTLKKLHGSWSLSIEVVSDLEKATQEILALTEGSTPELVRNIDVLEIMEKYSKGAEK